MHRKVFYFLFGWVLIAVGYAPIAYAQEPARDTLKLTLPQAEQQFLKNNLDLIIQRYNIDISKAQVITARLFDNPNLSLENGLYNPTSKTFLDMSHDNGQSSAALSQLFTTAGKRNKNIQLAKLGVKLSEYQFFDLLRTLKYTLRKDYYKIYFQQESAKVYQQEISSLQRTLKAFELQYTKGNIAQKEVLRIKSLLYSLQSELNDARDAIDDVQSEFKLLMRADASAFVVATLSFDLDGKEILTKVPYKQLLDSASNNRYDLKVARTTVDQSNLNLRLQHSMAIPDLTVSLTYDKQGSYIRNYNGLGISFPLPFFNRNQGNIKQAKITVDASKVALQSRQDQIESEIANSYMGASRLERLYNSFDPQFRGDFEHLIGEVYKNYEKRNISLLEFIDFYDSYKQNTIQFNNLRLNRISSLEELNYVTGTPFFNR